MNVDQAGRLELHYVAAKNDVEQARSRLIAGDDPNLGDNKGYTPLHFAALEYSVDVAKLLLERGAEVDKPDAYGNTPLWTAVFNSKGRGALIDLLRSHGADPHHRNNAGRTPLELAHTIANYDVAQFFTDVDAPGT